jgi:hypothetical protein
LLQTKKQSSDPALDVKCSAHDKPARPRERVRTLAGGKELPHRAAGADLVFRIPLIEDYEVVVIESTCRRCRKST